MVYSLESSRRRRKLAGSNSFFSWRQVTLEVVFSTTVIEKNKWKKQQICGYTWLKLSSSWILLFLFDQQKNKGAVETSPVLLWTNFDVFCWASARCTVSSNKKQIATVYLFEKMVGASSSCGGIWGTMNHGSSYFVTVHAQNAKNRFSSLHNSQLKGAGFEGSHLSDLAKSWNVLATDLMVVNLSISYFVSCFLDLYDAWYF